MANRLERTFDCGHIQTAYRGVQLAAQRSKVLERMLMTLMAPRMTNFTLAAFEQFAYTKERGARGVWAFL